MPNTIYLIGFMGAGKSTLGTELAHNLSRPFIDLDILFSRRYQLSIPHYFQRFGEAAFRDVESSLLAEHHGLDAVIATGGGVIVFPQNRTLLQDHCASTIWLHPAWKILWRRIQSSDRPLVTEHTEAQLQQIWQDRLSLYASCADLVITSEDSAVQLREVLGFCR